MKRGLLITKLGLPLFLALIIAFGAASGVAARATSEPKSTDAQQDFQDVPTDNPFYGNLHSIYSAGIVSGYTCSFAPGTTEPCGPGLLPYYRPGALVTRIQMAKFVDLARQQPGIYIDTGASVLPLFSRTTVLGGDGLRGEATLGFGVHGVSTTAGGYAGVFGENGGGGYGVRGISAGEGVFGESNVSGNGVHGKTSAGGTVAGVFGESSGGGIGVRGVSAGEGVYGESTSTGNGVQGVSRSIDDSGVIGQNMSGGYGVAARSNGTGIRAGIFAETTVRDSAHNAAYFAGNVEVDGACCAAAASTIKIDHPQDPANKYLIQSTVTSPDMMGIYNGNVTLDAKGEALVTMPSYFESLNGDYRYQLTAVGAPSPNLYVAQKIQGNKFKISGGAPGSEISWQVTGVRHDPYAVRNPITVEQDKSPVERGSYRNPEVYGKSDSESVVNAQR